MVAFAITAVAIAVLLRHAAHVYGGYSPADIRVCALMSVPLVAILLALSGGKASDTGNDLPRTYPRASNSLAGIVAFFGLSNSTNSFGQDDDQGERRDAQQFP